MTPIQISGDGWPASALKGWGVVVEIASDGAATVRVDGMTREDAVGLLHEAADALEAAPGEMSAEYYAALKGPRASSPSDPPAERHPLAEEHGEHLLVGYSGHGAPSPDAVRCVRCGAGMVGSGALEIQAKTACTPDPTTASYGPPGAEDGDG